VTSRKFLYLGHATVDAELDARDVATVVGRQKDDGLRDFVGQTNAPEWNLRLIDPQ
jgi:hypothetical protein